MNRVEVLRRSASALFLAFGLGACSGSQTEVPATAPPSAVRGQVLQFRYESIDGAPFSTEAFLGRLTVIGFLTTYDFASQAEARFLSAVATRHAPRVNVAALVLESGDNKPIVDAFVRTLGLRYPAALADAATIAGHGPFSGLHHVPSIVILDRRGREAFRHVGLIDEPKIHEALRKLEAEPQ